MEGAKQDTTEATAATATETATATAAGVSKRTTKDPPAHRKDNGAGGKYCAGSRGTEESSDESAKWSGEETEDLVSAEEAETVGGAGEAGRLLTETETAGKLERSGAEDAPGGAAAGGAPPPTPPPRMWSQQEWETAMGREEVKGKGVPSRGKLGQ